MVTYGSRVVFIAITYLLKFSFEWLFATLNVLVLPVFYPVFMLLV